MPRLPKKDPKREALLNLIAQSQAAEPPLGMSPDTHGELKTAVNMALEQLAPRERKILLRRAQGQTLKEAGKEMGDTIPTPFSHIHIRKDISDPARIEDLALRKLQNSLILRHLLPPECKRGIIFE